MHLVHELPKPSGPNLAALDLNLLLTLEALLLERSVSKAAVRLGRSQSAVSHALDRLRRLFEDPLLCRDGWGMRATPRAEALELPLSRALNDIRTLLQEVEGFEPRVTQRELVIATPDLFAPLLGPLVTALAAEAPGLRLSLRALPSPDGLRSGAVHLELRVVTGSGSAGLECARLGTFEWATFARKGHPIRRRPRADEWAMWPHVQVGTGNAALGPVSRAALAAGIERQIHVRVPSFLAALPMIAGSDMLFTTLRKPFQDVARGMRLRVIACPLDLPSVDIDVATRLGSDAAVTWLRDRLVATCSHREPRSNRPTSRRGR